VKSCLAEEELAEEVEEALMEEEGANGQFTIMRMRTDETKKSSYV